MPRNASGSYTLPSGNPVVSGDNISSTWANDTMGDIATALTNSLARDGSGGMTAPFRAVDGTVSVPGLSFANETGSGLYRSAAGDVGLAILGSLILRLRSTGVDITGTLAVNGNKADAFPTGTKLPFAQAAAPTGWTQVTDDSADNRMLRVVNTAGGGTAGTHSPILNNVVPSHTHGFTTGTVSADHAHYFNQNTNAAGSHRHPIRGGSNDLGYRWTSDGGTIPSFASSADQGYVWDNGWGAIMADAGSHAHNVQGWTGGISSNHTHSGSTDNGSSQTNWAPRYINMIICSKN